MSSVIGLSGSLRRGSYNAALLRAAKAAAPAGLVIDIASIEGIPLYNADVESEGMPPAVTALKDKIAAADGLLLVTPEYNQSIPGVFKNAIDWLSRPPKDMGRVFRDRPVGLIGATPGRGATRMAQAAWQPVFRTLGVDPFWGKDLAVGGAGQVFDEAGVLVDEKIRELLTAYLEGFAAFVERSRASRG